LAFQVLRSTKLQAMRKPKYRVPPPRKKAWPKGPGIKASHLLGFAVMAALLGYFVGLKKGEPESNSTVLNPVEYQFTNHPSAARLGPPDNLSPTRIEIPDRSIARITIPDPIARWPALHSFMLTPANSASRPVEHQFDKERVPQGLTSLGRIQITRTRVRNHTCDAGEYDQYTIIAPFETGLSSILDSTLRRALRCTSEHVIPISISSPGGKMDEAMKVAKVYRQSGVWLHVADYCHSACAISMLAAPIRTMKSSATISYHAPYKQTEHGIDCTPSEATLMLEQYFHKVVGSERGGKIYKQMMSYCYQKGGWELFASAARNFGVVHRYF